MTNLLTQVSLVRALVDKLRPTCVLTTTIVALSVPHTVAWKDLAFDVQPALVQPVIEGFEWHLENMRDNFKTPPLFENDPTDEFS
nr:hypothetical protein [Limosilactobacillus fermentum]